MITGDPKGTTSQDRVRGFVERLLEDGHQALGDRGSAGAVVV